MTRDNEQYAYLGVVGDFDPSTITAQLSLEPTEAWAKGDVNEKTRLERRFSRWALHSRLEKTASLEDHVQDVLQQALPRAEEIRRLGIEHELVLQLVGYFYKDYPGFGLDRDVVTSLALLNVDIDCDFYYLYSDSREDS